MHALYYQILLKIINMSYKIDFSHFIGITVKVVFTQLLDIRDMSIYYKNVSNILQEKSFKFTSKDLKHDTAFLYEVISIFCKYVKQNYQSLKIVEHFLMLVQSSIKI